MKRLWILIGTITLVLCVSFVGCGDSADSNGTAPTEPPSSNGADTSDVTTSSSDGSETITLRFALFQPEVSPISQANIAFAKAVEERTNNRVKIEIYPGGSLLNAAAMFQGVIDGVADMGNSSSIYDPGAFPFTSIAELPCAVQSGWAGSNALYDFMEKYQPAEWSGVQLLTTASTAGSFQSVGVKGKEIRTLEDWKGVSLRSMDSDIIKAMGATAKDLPMSDVYDAISKGVIDGQMGHFEIYKTWKLGEVVDWVAANPGGVQFSAMWYNFMNIDTWERLPGDIKEVFREVGREHSPKIGLAWDEQSAAGANFLKELNKTIYMVTTEESDRWDEIILGVVETRLKNLVKSSGISEQEVEEIWSYYQERVNFWNDAQAESGVMSLQERLSEILDFE